MQQIIKLCSSWGKRRLIFLIFFFLIIIYCCCFTSSSAPGKNNKYSQVSWDVLGKVLAVLDIYERLNIIYRLVMVLYCFRQSAENSTIYKKNNRSFIYK